MRIWLIKAGEPLPTDGPRIRQLRMSVLARYLAAAGHDITWWTSTFDHYQKKQRSMVDAVHEISPTYRIRLLHSPGYGGNVSLARIRDHAIIARRIRESLAAEEAPDLIVCSYPTVDLAREATMYAGAHGVPVVLDVRDLWPDYILRVFPKPVRWIGRALLSGPFRDSRMALGAATAVTGCSPGFVAWGLERGARTATELDRYFPFGYPILSPPQSELDRASGFWDDLGVKADDGVLTVYYSGILGTISDWRTPVEAVLEARKQGASVRLVLCGKGKGLDVAREAAQGSPDIVFPGWIDAIQMHVGMRRSHMGLMPHSTSESASLYGGDIAIPNKMPEYMSASLPIATGLARGAVPDMIVREGFGISYGGDRSRFASELVRLAADRPALAAMARRSGEVFAEQFEVDRVYNGFVAYLEQVAAAHPARKPQG